MAPERLAACTGAPELAPCTTRTIDAGLCIAGVCGPVVCGDGVALGPEVCDDNNQRSGDGCSADCQSDERCGNGYRDGIAGEQCDDGVAGLSGDGCSSTCTTEIDLWVDRTPRLPEPRRAHAMAYDRGRHRLVVFGGANGGDHTWEWDGAAWREYVPVTSPPARSGHAMAYDARRGRVVLFGGATSSGVVLDDTWLWDGIAWTRSSPPSSPPARSGAAMAYDAVREEVVLFGGARPTPGPGTVPRGSSARRREHRPAPPSRWRGMHPTCRSSCTPWEPPGHGMAPTGPNARRGSGPTTNGRRRRPPLSRWVAPSTRSPTILDPADAGGRASSAGGSRPRRHARSRRVVRRLERECRHGR